MPSTEDYLYINHCSLSIDLCGDYCCDYRDQQAIIHRLINKKFHCQIDTERTCVARKIFRRTNFICIKIPSNRRHFLKLMFFLCHSFLSSLVYWLVKFFSLFLSVSFFLLAYSVCIYIYIYISILLIDVMYFRSTSETVFRSSLSQYPIPWRVVWSFIDLILLHPSLALTVLSSHTTVQWTATSFLLRM